MDNCFVIKSRLYAKVKLIIYELLVLFERTKPFTKVANVSEKEDINVYVENILDEYGNNILRLAYSYLHNMSDAEDILQDTMIQLLNKKPKFANNDHEKAWLLRVTTNLSKNRIKYNFIRKTDELDEMLVQECREDLSFIWKAIKELPPKYSEVIHLFHYEGYSTSQISEILNKKESTVRSNLSRGRAKLKDILKEEYYFDEKLW